MQTTVTQTGGDSVLVGYATLVLSGMEQVEFALNANQYSPGSHSLSLGTSGHSITAALTLTQLEHLESLIRVYLREQEAAARHVDPVTGCPFCPEVAVPDGTGGHRWKLDSHTTRSGVKMWCVVDATTGCTYVDGVSRDVAQHVLEGLLDPTPTVQIAD